MYIFAGRTGKMLWVVVMGMMALATLLVAISDTRKLHNMQPVDISLKDGANLEYLEEAAQSDRYVVSTPVTFTFEDGHTLISDDSRISTSELKQLLSGKSLEVYYNEQYPNAVFDASEKPNPLPWWIASFVLVGVFLLGIKLWKQDYGE